MIIPIILVLAVASGAVRAQTGCDTKVDVTFLIDSSTNVGRDNFNKELDFVKSVTNHMQLSPDKAQVSAVTFGTGAANQFDLNQYTSHGSLQNAIDSIQFKGGQPALADAIRYATGSSFSPIHGGRGDAPHVAVILTNQPSGSFDRVKLEAQTARDNGLILYTVGVGGAVDLKELQEIASDPNIRHSFVSQNFDALNSLSDLVASKICNELPPDPAMIPAPTGCLKKADVVFMIDSSTSVGSTNFQKLEHFLKDVVQNVEVGPNNVQFGVVKYGSYPTIEFPLGMYTTRPETMKALEAMTYIGGGTNDADALTYTGNQVLSQSTGARGDVPRIAIMITDGGSANPAAAIKAADKLRTENIGVMTVGVGNRVNNLELTNIADKSDFAFNVASYDNLDSITNQLINQMCTVTAMQPSLTTNMPGASLPPDPCHDKLPNCDQYGADTCTSYASWAHENCAKTCKFCTPLYTPAPPKCQDTLPDCSSYGIDLCSSSYMQMNCQLFCGLCSANSTGSGYYGKCSYKGKTYKTGENWYDGCDYECICEDGNTGRYKCNNRCPVYHDLPTDCTLVAQPGDCCLQPVCNFNPLVNKHQSSGHGVTSTGIDVCVYKTKQFFQGQTWRDGCDFQCTCTDAKTGLYSCEDMCPTYNSIPPYCHLEQKAGECCLKPVCEFDSQTGSFQGTGSISGNGVGATPTEHPPCIDAISTCTMYGSDVCVTYRGWASINCQKYCNMCPSGMPIAGPNDHCVYGGKTYNQGETWTTSCSSTCTCENAIYGYYRCVDSCPFYNNVPVGCSVVKKTGDCCPVMQCNTGYFLSSSTHPGSIGNGGNIAVLKPPTGMIQVSPTLSTGQQLVPGTGGTGFHGPTLDGCLYKGTVYVQNQAWEDGCSLSCYCKDAYTGLYTCKDKCPSYPQLPPSCVLVTDSNDECCKTPLCQPDPITQQIPIPIPVFKPATQSHGSVMPPTGNELTSGAYSMTVYLVQTGMTPAPPTAPAVPINTGGIGYCLYNGQTYQHGQVWEDGCDFNCVCDDASKGHYTCTEKCVHYGNLPSACYLVKDPVNPCCDVPRCDLPVNYITHMGELRTTTPKPAGEYCVYEGVQYQQGQTWYDGCSYKCTCENAANDVYRCLTRCPQYENIDTDFCTFVPDPRDPSCCQMPKCSYPGSTTAPNTVTGAPPGTFVGQGPKRGYCEYKEVQYTQGQTWQDGCDLTCECTDEESGLYRCKETCERFNDLPPYCTLITDFTNPCCKKPKCNFQGTTASMTGTALPTLAPTPPPPGQTAGPTQPPHYSYCLYKGVHYSQGQSWEDGCQYRCRCDDSDKGLYVCNDRCANYNNVPSYCTMVTDPEDTCCLVPSCPLTPAPTIPGQPTPSPGPYQLPTFPPGEVTGAANVPTPRPGMTPPPINYCEYKGVQYSQGQKWDDGCDYVCECVDSVTGKYKCLEKCTKYPELPLNCRLSKDPANPCCSVPECSGIPTPAPPVGLTNAPPPTNPPQHLCVYKGQSYSQGQQWYDGCDYVCICEDEVEGVYTCNERCPSYGSLPPECHMIQSSSDPLCCKEPKCEFTNTKNQTTGYLTPPTPPPGVIDGGAATPTPKPTVPGAPTPVPQPSVCIYKGNTYQQGQQWRDGCDYNCECVDSMTGHYRCTEMCAKYDDLPSGCRLITDPYNPCCKTAYCPAKNVPTPAPPGSPTPTPAPKTGCMYNGVMFHQGEQWNDGCDLVCVCEDEMSGFYRCRDRCNKYEVPENCQMVTDPRDSCCRVPYCPPATTPAPWYPGMIPTPAPGYTFAPEKIPTPAPGQTYAPGMYPTWVPGMVPTPAPGYTFAPEKIPTPAPGQTYAPGYYPTWAPGMVPTPAPGFTFAPDKIPTPAPGQTYAPGYYPTWVPGMIPTPAPGFTFAPNKIPTPAPGQTYAPGYYPTWVPGMVPTPAPGFTFAPNKIPTPAPGYTYAPGMYPTYVPGMVPTPAPGYTYAPDKIPTPAPGYTYAPGQFPTYVPGMMPTPAPGYTYAPEKIPTPAPGQTYAPGMFPTWVPGMVPTPAPGYTYPPYMIPTPAPGQTFAPGKFPVFTPAPWPTPAPGQTFAPYIPGMIPTPGPGQTYAPNIIPTPAPGQTYAPGQFPTWVPGMVPTFAPGTTMPPWLIPTPAPGQTYAPFQYPTWIPGMVPTPAPGYTFAPNLLPTPAPGLTYAPGNFPTYVPGMVPTPAPGFTFAPNKIPTPAPGQTYAPGMYPTWVPGMVPTPAPGQTFAPNRIPTPAPGQTYAPGLYPTWVPGMAPTPAPGFTFAPDKIPTPAPGQTFAPGYYPTWVPGMVPTPAPGYTFAPDKVPTPAPGQTYAPGYYPTWVPGMAPTPAPGYTFAPNKIPTPAPGQTYAPGFYPTWVPGMVPTPAPGFTFAPNKIPTPAPGQTYAPGYYPTWVPGMVPTPAPGVTYAPDKIPTPAPGYTYSPGQFPTYVPGMVPTPAPGYTYAPDKVPTPAPGQTYAPGMYPTWVPGMAPTPAPGYTYPPYMIPTPAPGQTYAPGKYPEFTPAPQPTPVPGQTFAPYIPGMIPTPGPGQTYAPNVIPTPAPGQTYAPGQFPTWVPGMVPTFAPGTTMPPWLVPTPAPGQTYAPFQYPTWIPGMIPTPAPGYTFAPDKIPTPAPGLTYAPGNFPTWVPGMVPTPAPGVTYSPYIIPTPAPGQTYAPGMYPTWLPGMMPTPAPGVTFAPNKIPTPAPGQTYAPGFYPTWVPGMVPTPAPGVTFAPNKIPTPAPGQTYAPGYYPTWVPGMVPTPAPEVTFAPNKIPTPAPGQTYAPGFYPTWVPGMVPTPAPGVTYAPNKIPTPAPGQTYAPGYYPTWVPGMVPTPAPGYTFAPSMVPTPAPGQTYAPGMYPTWVPGMAPTPAPGYTYPPYMIPTPAPGQTYAPGKYPEFTPAPQPTPVPGQTFAPYIPGMIPTPGPGQTYAPNIIPTPAPGQTYAPGQFPTWVPGMVPTFAPGTTMPPWLVPTPAPGQTYAPFQYPTWIPGMIPTPAPGYTFALNMIPTPSVGQTYAPGNFPTWVPGMVPTPAPFSTFAPNKIPTPAPGQTYAPGYYPTWVPGMVPTPAPGVTFAPNKIPTPAPGQTYAPGFYPTWVPGMIPTPAPGVTFAPNKIPTPAPGQTYAPGFYPTWVPGMVPTPAPGVTYAPNKVPTPAPGQTYAPGYYPTWVPGMMPTPAPGYTYAPSMIPTPAPGQTYAPGMYPTWVPGMAPTPAPGYTYPPYMIPTPAPGQTYAPGKYPEFTPAPQPTPAIGQTFAPYIPGMIPTPGPGQTYAPNIIPTPAPGQTYAPGQFPTWVPGMVPTFAPGTTMPPWLVPTPAPGQTYAPFQYPTWIPGMIPTPAPGFTFAPNMIPTPSVGQTYAPGNFPTWVPGMMPTPAPGFTFAPNKVPTPAPGQTYAPGYYPTWVPGMVPTPAPGVTYAPNKVPTPAPGYTYPPGQFPTWVPGMVPTPAPGFTFAPNMIPTPAPGQTYAPGMYPTWVPGMMPTPAPGFTFAPNKIPTPAPGQTYAPGFYPTWVPGMAPTPAPGYTYAPNMLPTPAPGLTYAPGMFPTPTPTINIIPTAIPGVFQGSGVNGNKSGCVHYGVIYKQGEKWQDGCQFDCECLDEHTGRYQCVERCPPYLNLPSNCRLVIDPNDACCKIPFCVTPAPTTVAPPMTPTPAPNPYLTFPPAYSPTPAPSVVPTPQPRTQGCVMNGQIYVAGQSWYLGCDKKCVCEDGMTGFYRCFDRCAAYSSVPNGCTLVPDPKDPTCCEVPQCVPMPSPGQTLPTGQPITVTGVPGVISGSGTPAPTPGPNGITSAPRNVCVYNGRMYQPGDKWQDGCQYNCVCVDGMTGKYDCTERCPTFPFVPAECTMKRDPNDICCFQPVCEFGKTTPAPFAPTLSPPFGPTTPPPLPPSYCVYKGVPYSQGQTWDDGCTKKCRCDDADMNIYTCFDRCKSYNNLGSGCVMVMDPMDSCCQVPTCTYVPTPVPGGPTPCPIPMPTAVPGQISGSPPTNPITGAQPTNIGYCEYKGVQYKQGQSWDDGCAYNCVCMDGSSGLYQCEEKCPRFVGLPSYCSMIQDPQDSCCQKPTCDVCPQTPAPFTGLPTLTPPPSLAPTPAPEPKCIMGGKTYSQGQKWYDGCKQVCVCDDALTGAYTCTDRCPTYTPLPGCVSVPDPNDPMCCLAPKCDGNPGVYGIVNGSGTPPTPSYITGPTIVPPSPTSPPPKVCVYKGNSYTQGQKWQDGCQFDCECVDADAGNFKCVDRCPRYPNLPATCHMVYDPTNPCCMKPECVTNNPTPGPGSTLSPYPTPSTTDFCVYQGVPLRQGQTFNQGCDKICKCEDAVAGKITCTDRCPTYPPMNATCSMVTNPSDQCCQIPQCRNPITGAITGVPGTITGSNLPNTNYPPGTGTRDGCVYNGQIYQQSQTWDDGCKYTCTCYDSTTGRYSCTEKCPSIPPLPSYCTLTQVDKCCQEPNCQPIVPSTPSPTSGFTPAPPNVCVYKGSAYQQGQQWYDGCDQTCVCEDAMKNIYRCQARCAKYTNIQPGCTLVPDPMDPTCCQTPQCRLVVPPSPSPGFYTVAPAPGGVITGNGHPTPAPGSTIPPPYRDGCVYKGMLFFEGQKFDDGCDYTCVCLSNSTGQYRCEEKCYKYTSIPSECHMVQDPNNPCCQIPYCDSMPNPILPTPGAVPTPLPGVSTVAPYIVPGLPTTVRPGIVTPATQGTTISAPKGFCVYKGVYYTQGQTWDDGCSLKCRCDDVTHGYYTCAQRCPSYPRSTCPLKTDPSDSCCLIPDCNTGNIPTPIPTPGPGQVTSSPFVTPKPISGSFTGTSGGNPVVVPYLPGQTSTGNTPACIYKGSIYTQGQKWDDGCTYKCECVDANAGQYKCDDRCPRFPYLPPNCHYQQSATDLCCQEPICDTYIQPTTAAPFTGPTTAAPDKCVYTDGSQHPPGSKWQVGCAEQCVCENPATNLYTCNQLCPSYSGLPAGCTLVQDPANLCCVKPVCSLPNGIDLTPVIHTPNSTDTSTPPNALNIVPIGTHTVFTGYARPNNPPGTIGQRNQCVYKGTVYNQGQSWDDGCQYVCSCVDGTMGLYKCTSKCPLYPQLPTYCHEVNVPGQCCPSITCDIPGYGTYNPVPQLVPTPGPSVPPPTGVSTTPSYLIPNPVTPSFTTLPGGGYFLPNATSPTMETHLRDKCVYKNRIYNQGDVWTDGCDYSCECLDARAGYYGCKPLCPVYNNLPSAQCMVVKSADQCCNQPMCYDPKTDQLVNPLTSNSVFPVVGTYNGGFSGFRPTYSMPGTSTGLRTGCYYKGITYRQDQKWDDGCDFTCTCLDASKGLYQCNQKCPAYTKIPPLCQLVNKDSCCKEVICNSMPTGGVIPTGITTSQPITQHPDCYDKLDNCNSYGVKACSTVYGDWGQRNCKLYCGFCPFTAPPPKCEDKLPDCRDYGLSACSGIYEPWAMDNCRQYCNLCPSTPVPTPSGIQTQPPGDCKDVSDTCGILISTDYDYYCKNKDFFDFSYANCRKSCDMCSLTSSVSPSPSPTASYPWMLFLKGVAGAPGPDLYQLWHSHQTMNPNEPLASHLTSEFNGHYKPDYSNHWNDYCIDQVKVSIYNNGIEKVSIVFNATGATKENWFTSDRIISSSYTDIKVSQKETFSMAGDANTGREWYISGHSSPQDPCDSFGWFMISTKTSCPFEMGDPKPSFYYAPGTNQAHWGFTNPGTGDVFAIQAHPTCMPGSGGHTPHGGQVSVTTQSAAFCTYKGQQHAHGTTWTDGCQFNCSCEDASIGFYRCRDLCPSYAALPPGCSLVTKPNECCATPNCVLGITTLPPQTFVVTTGGCYANNKVYYQGQTWSEGCSKSCTCTDASSGSYSCRSLCLRWNTLPNSCHLEDPPAGLCCQQPRCPATIVIQIPSAYKDEYPGYTYV